MEISRAVTYFTTEDRTNIGYEILHYIKTINKSLALRDLNDGTSLLYMFIQANPGHASSGLNLILIIRRANIRILAYRVPNKLILLPEPPPSHNFNTLLIIKHKLIVIPAPPP